MTDELAGKTTTRPDMVAAARRFMITPKVKETPYEEQKQFLLGKGVTLEEIEEARSSIPAAELAVSQPLEGVQPMNYAGQQQMPYPYPMQPQQNKYVSMAQTAVVLGSISYAGYRFLRSYVLPKFFDIPDPATEEIRQLQQQMTELQNSMKFVMDSVSQTTQQLAEQQQEISRTLFTIGNRDADLSKIETGISTIKSLMLSHSNFAPITVPAVTTIPSWQQAVPSSSTTTTATAGYMTPPANFKEDKKQLSEEDAEKLEGMLEQVDEQRRTEVRSLILRRLRALARNYRPLSSKNGDQEEKDDGLIGQYHDMPMGTSDLTQKTRVTFMSREMKESEQVMIVGMSTHGFRLMNNIFVYGPIACFPRTVLSWRVLTPNDIKPESLSLFTSLEPRLDLLLIGAGDKKCVDSVRARIYPYLKKCNIPFEVMDTINAFSTFNWMNNDGRYVAAGLYPPDELQVSDQQHREAMAQLYGYGTLENHPMDPNLGRMFDKTSSIIKTLWSGKDEDFEEAKRRVRIVENRSFQKKLK
ncbi:hypothetical protein WR25_05806 [Diploscapter pachys]|uniref:Peroxisome membrane anchor protein Pex14p N-terminal domain-containing protein n=1 Tax=Diploscapter pachys TaxID=2018661 RepID=A0A2A2JPR6_9BILA|nr:hypothetical protein WR25_05806 [Diploscapter pachys]